MILGCLLRAILGGGAVGKGEEQKVILSSLGFTNSYLSCSLQPCILVCSPFVQMKK